MTTFLNISNGIPRRQTLPGTSAIYNQSYSVASTISAGTPITLPGGGTYTDAELEVELNGQLLDAVVDYAYVGSPPRTQVSFTFDLINLDVITFRKTRDP